MAESTIQCPECKATIKLTESEVFSLTQTKHNENEAKIAAEVAKRENTLQAQFAETLEKEQKTIAAKESKKATELQVIVNEQNKKLIEAQTAQTHALKKQRELDNALREQKLIVEKQIQERLPEIQENERKRVNVSNALKIKEKDETIASMTRDIANLNQSIRQKAHPQFEGEAMELVLEGILNSKFPHDSIEPVPQGVSGGDILHRVISTGRVDCGTILWESKRTKTWKNDWLTKLRNDQRTAKAEICILVSKTLPKGFDKDFERIDGVWVCAPQSIPQLAEVLRYALISVANSKQIQVGQKTKSEIIYQYFTGAEFRLRVDAIVEAFSIMREDLDKERKVITKQWAKREQQIGTVIDATSGMYGDIQGIAGQSALEIDALDLDTLNADITKYKK